MANREVLAVIKPGQRVTVRAVAMRPGETHADACRREDERSARIAARVAELRKCNLSGREAEAQACEEAAH